jgi:methylaspartate ammonia-lyase
MTTAAVGGTLGRDSLFESLQAATSRVDIVNRGIVAADVDALSTAANLHSSCLAFAATWFLPT